MFYLFAFPFGGGTGVGGFGDGGKLRTPLPSVQSRSQTPAQAPPAFAVRPGSRQTPAWPLEGLTSASPPRSAFFLAASLLEPLVPFLMPWAIPGLEF